MVVGYICGGVVPEEEWRGRLDRRVKVGRGVVYIIGGGIFEFLAGLSGRLSGW